ncbi:MAG: hypothetical protein SGI92_00425 [Bryobacteraceae bacterium]|nr:hypothetical protein [Bryobacteraceae bacterium]
MRKLTQLWRAIEKIPGLTDIPAAWEVHCGAEFSLVRPHLRSTDVLGYRYPCPNPRDADCPRAIVDHGDGTFEAICRHPHRMCEDKALAASDVLVHELDLTSFFRSVTQALGLRWQRPALRFPGVWAIGVSARVNTRSHPVFLQVQARRAAFLEGVRRLLVEIDGPFLLVAPTQRFRDVAVQEMIQARGIGFISLEDEIVVDDAGRFVAVDPVSSEDEPTVTPSVDRERAMNTFCQKYDCPNTRIAEEAAVDISDLYKWKRDELPKRSKKSARIEAVLKRGLIKRTG